MSVIKHYEPHPLALIFPAMDDQGAKWLARDIKQNGLQNPIVLHEGKILDGVQRQAACESANVYPSYSQFDNLPEWKRKGGPLAFVISQNLHRRHLTTGQRAGIAADLENMKQGRPAKEGKHVNLHVKRSDAAKLLKVSPSTVATAAKVKREAPEKFAAIKAGELAPSKAAREIEAKKRKRKLLNGDDASKVFDREEFKTLVWKCFKQLLRRFDLKHETEVRLELVNLLLGKSEGLKEVLPVSVTYPDGTTRAIRDVIVHRHENAKHNAKA